MPILNEYGSLSSQDQYVCHSVAELWLSNLSAKIPLQDLSLEDTRILLNYAATYVHNVAANHMAKRQIAKRKAESKQS